MSAEDSHVPALTGLRGMAILWVIPHNADVFPPIRDWSLPFAMLAHAGWIGVQLFFVLSGFLISRNLLRTRDRPNYYRAFFFRRALRIFPLYFLTLVFFLVLLPRFKALSPEILHTYSQQKWLWLFLSNWTQPYAGTVYWFPHFWSLAVEEQFYLLWPFAIALLPRSAHVTACVSLIAAAFLTRLALLLFGGNIETVYMFTACRMDALAAGALAALVSPRCAAPLRVGALWPALSAAAVVSGALASHLYARTDPVTMTAGYLLLAVMAAALVLVCSGTIDGPGAARIRSILTTKWLQSVGKYSFGMYVFHLPILLLLPARSLPGAAGSGGQALEYAVVVTLMAYICAGVSFHLLESHFLALKERFRFARTVPAR